MQTYELDFAKINVIREDIAEVIVKDGTEMDENMVDIYHDFLISHLHAPFSLLINKINSYTYTFPAQQKLATIKQINAMAVVTYSDIATVTTQSLAALPRDVEWNLKVFSGREQALNWLLEEQGQKQIQDKK